ncbi:hypothetical protein HYW83_01370 [Candidatus Peregrinibacteria bacterium]|nr:hypothetical protein [Candidatus Peregrinibacteria bacterium]
MKVLLVEDDRMDLRLYEVGLASKKISYRYGLTETERAVDDQQINVVIVTTLREALEVLDRGTWDMVISDLNFPEESGGVVDRNGITMVTEALRRGVKKVYLNTTNGSEVHKIVPAGVIVLPDKLGYKDLANLLQGQE